MVSSLEGRGVAQPVVLPVAVSTRANSLALRRTPKKRGMKEKTKSHVVARTHDTIQPNLSAQSKRRPQKRSSSRPQEESTQGRRAWARARACSEGLSNFTHCTAGGFKIFMKERRTEGVGESGRWGEVGRWGDLVYARWHGNNVVMTVHSSAGKTRWNCDSYVTSGWCYVPRVLCELNFSFVREKSSRADRTDQEVGKGLIIPLKSPLSRLSCWNPTIFLLFQNQAFLNDLFL